MTNKKGSYSRFSLVLVDDIGDCTGVFVDQQKIAMQTANALRVNSAALRRSHRVPVTCFAAGLRQT